MTEPDVTALVEEARDLAAQLVVPQTKEEKQARVLLAQLADLLESLQTDNTRYKEMFWNWYDGTPAAIGARLPELEPSPKEEE
jgi:hypothetical protein